MTRRSHVVALVVAAAVIAACTSEQSTVRTVTPTTEVTPTSSVAETTPTTATAESTVPATSAPATTPPTSTTPATTLPAGPAAVGLAILGGSGDGGWLNLGSWDRTRWERATGPSGPVGIDVEAGTTLTVSNLDGRRNATAGAAADSCFDERTGPTITPAVAAPDPPGFGYGALAFVPPSWPLTPRPVTTTDATVAAYEALGEAAFAGEAVDARVGEIEQLVIADLDGDGDDEALTVFESPAAPSASAAPGDFAALLLVDTATRSASTVLSSLVASDAQGGFFVIDRYRVIDVVDLNGDGRMEVAVHAWYFEGAAVLIYEYDGTRLTEVLAAGCGT